MTEQRTPAEIVLASSFETMKDKGAPALRQSAWSEFARQGLPNRRVEAWHYTDLRAALRVVTPVGEASKSAPAIERVDDGVRLVTLDGVFRADLSDLTNLPDGVSVQSLRDVLAQGDAQTLAALAPEGFAREDPVVALNAALMQDGVVVRIAPGAPVARPLQIETLTSGAVAQSVYTRSLIMVGEGASVRIDEASRALSPSGVQENSALVVAVGAGARVEQVAYLAPAAEDAVRVLSLLVSLERESAFNSFCMIEDGGFLRRQIFARLAGEDASVAFDGVSLLRKRQHADTTLIVDHAAAHGRSRERFRTILDGEATGVFQGKVIVRPGAQKTDGAMQSKALLLSEGSAMNNKPELEIFADDVVCGHGATCGRLDADQLFYLRARGLPHREAEALLIEGFANEAIESVEDDASRERFSTRLASWLAKREAEDE
jgi:Fe-S cluster assembly protein SufD